MNNEQAAEGIQEAFGVTFVLRLDPVDHTPISTLTEAEVVKIVTVMAERIDKLNRLAGEVADLAEELSSRLTANQSVSAVESVIRKAPRPSADAYDIMAPGIDSGLTRPISSIVVNPGDDATRAAVQGLQAAQRITRLRNDRG